MFPASTTRLYVPVLLYVVPPRRTNRLLVACELPWNGHLPEASPHELGISLSEIVRKFDPQQNMSLIFTLKINLYCCRGRSYKPYPREMRDAARTVLQEQCCKNSAASIVVVEINNYRPVLLVLPVTSGGLLLVKRR